MRSSLNEAATPRSPISVQYEAAEETAASKIQIIKVMKWSLGGYLSELELGETLPEA